MVDTRLDYNVEQIREDLKDRGWLPRDLARVCDLSDATISLFLNGYRQTPRTAKKIADAFGKSVRRYRTSSEHAA